MLITELRRSDSCRFPHILPDANEQIPHNNQKFAARSRPNGMAMDGLEGKFNGMNLKVRRFTFIVSCTILNSLLKRTLKTISTEMVVQLK